MGPVVNWEYPTLSLHQVWRSGFTISMFVRSGRTIGAGYSVSTPGFPNKPWRFVSTARRSICLYLLRFNSRTLTDTTMPHGWPRPAAADGSLVLRATFD